MDKNSKMITMDEMGKVTGITVAGVNFSTKEAFVEYREKHQFKMGDAVQALLKSYSDTKVVPAFICGINDFGNDRISIDLCYITPYDKLEFDCVFSDESLGGKPKDSGIIGLAPLNEFNDVGLKVANVMQSIRGIISAKELELDKLRQQVKILEDFKTKTETGNNA